MFLREEKTHVLIGETAFRATVLTEHLALIMPRVEQNASVIELPHVSILTFENLQKAAFGRVQQPSRDVCRFPLKIAPPPNRG